MWVFFNFSEFFPFSLSADPRTSTHMICVICLNTNTFFKYTVMCVLQSFCAYLLSAYVR